ncbi:uncharacterized protein SETTUDRAFT_89589 [Exserohilum turcica Et28A]|uniref:Glycosyltransferase 2 n=1 Tax=Exserohilum turcicum (strain 28A) TaxID=671987 RepID=R0IQU6_EXST2|nr:uncharacterized protein SETTUDRAFT_89589 [Exserohilum turcica Et28A]EOA87071.1 hypothetical protein SETTUDRAFT_89589 [Exserohilum turcica Et28A]
MYRKTILPTDEELGKKDDDHRFKPARKPGWLIWNQPVRWRRRRILLAVTGLVLLYYLFQGTAHGRAESALRQYPSQFGRPITPTYEKPTVDEDEPTGAPPGIQKPRRGDAAPHAYDGQIRYFRLASTLRSDASRTSGYEKKNQNIIFAMSSLKSASTLLAMACDMAKLNRNYVHAVFMGRDNIPLEDLLHINGIDTASCSVTWHDARPDYTEYSTDARAESAVKGAMAHINSFLHPQAAIIDDSSSENAFFVRGMTSKTDALQMALIQVPKDKLQDLTWVTRLDSASLKHWHDPIVDILIQVPPGSSSVLRLLQSIKDADYSGLRPPRITIELPAELDLSVKERIESFKWPPNSDEHTVGGGLVIRRRIANHHDSQEAAAIRFLELFYPANPSKSHVLLLCPQAQVARQYFHFVHYMVYEYKYSIFGAPESGGLMGVSLELPLTHLDNKKKLQPPTIKDMHNDQYKVSYPNAKDAPFLWQAPNSHATLFFGDKWAELHSFLSKRVTKRQALKKSVSRAKLVSETQPAWTEYMLELMRARGYSLLYPAMTSDAFVTIHNELYQAPEEFRVPPPTAGQEAQVPEKEDVFVRTGESRRAPPTVERHMVAGAVPLHEALPFDGNLPNIADLPRLLYDGQKIHPANVSIIAQSFADEFRQEIGGCRMVKGKHRKRVTGEAGDLFCFGNESEEDWEKDITREAEMFNAPIDDELEKLLVIDGRPPPSKTTSTTARAATRTAVVAAGV